MPQDMEKDTDRYFRNENGAITAGGWNGYPVYTVGSVADIPVDSIVAFVHNAV